MNIKKYSIKIITGLLFLSFVPMWSMEDPGKLTIEEKKIINLQEQLQEATDKLEQDPENEELKKNVEDMEEKLGNLLISFSESWMGREEKKASRVVQQMLPQYIEAGTISNKQYAKDKTYQNLNIDQTKVKFELLNNSNQTLFIRIGTAELWDTDETNWRPLRHGERLYSLDNITQFAYSSQSNPQFVEDVEYFVFNINGEYKKVFLQIKQQSIKRGTAKLVLKEQDPALYAGTKVPGAKGLIIAARKLGAQKGKISKTETGISLMDSIDLKDIIWLPYLYLPWKKTNPALYQIRELIIPLYRGIGDEVKIQNIIENIKFEIQKAQEAQFGEFVGALYPYNWTPLHEIALWFHAPYSEISEVLAGLYNYLKMEYDANENIPDANGQTPLEITESQLVDRIVKEYFVSESFIKKSASEEERRVKATKEEYKLLQEESKLVQKYDKELEDWQRSYVNNIESIKEIFGPIHPLSLSIKDFVDSYLDIKHSEDPIETRKNMVAVYKEQYQSMSDIPVIMTLLKSLDEDTNYIGTLIDLAPRLGWDAKAIFQEALQQEPLDADVLYNFIREKVEEGNNILAEFEASAKGTQKFRQKKLPEEAHPPISISPVEDILDIKEIIKQREEAKRLKEQEEAFALLQPVEIQPVEEEFKVEETRKTYFAVDAQYDEIYNASEYPIYVAFENKKGLPFDLRSAQLVTLTETTSRFKRETTIKEEAIEPQLKENKLDADNLIVELNSKQAIRIPQGQASLIFVTFVRPDIIEDAADVRVLLNTELKKPINISYRWTVPDKVEINFNNNKDFLQSDEVLYPPYGAIGLKVFGELSPANPALRDIMFHPEYFSSFLIGELPGSKAAFDEYAQNNGARALAYAIWFRNIDAVRYIVKNNFATGSDKNPFDHKEGALLGFAGKKETLLDLAQKLRDRLVDFVPEDKDKLVNIVNTLEGLEAEEIELIGKKSKKVGTKVIDIE